MKKIFKLIIFICGIIFSAYLYNYIQFMDFRDNNFFYYLYGYENESRVFVQIRWFFAICLLFVMIFHHYKIETSNNKYNQIVRYKTKRKFHLKVLCKGILKSLICWFFIILITGLFRVFKNEISFIEKDILVLITSSVIITTLTTLMIVIEIYFDSLYAFLITVGYTLLSIPIAGLSKNILIQCLLFPNFLMGVRHSNESLMIGLLFVCIIEIILIVLYFKLTDKKDIVR